MDTKELFHSFFFSNMVNRRDVASTALLNPPLIMQEKSGHSSRRLRHGCKNQVVVHLKGKRDQQHGASSHLWLSFTVVFLPVHQLCANSSAKKKKKSISKVHHKLPSLSLTLWSPGYPPGLRGHIPIITIFFNNVPALFFFVLFFTEGPTSSTASCCPRGTQETSRGMLHCTIS